MRYLSMLFVVLLAFSVCATSALATQYVAPSNNANQSFGSSNLLFLDNTNGRVGLGTIAPATRLDVNGVVTATTFSGAGTSLTGTASSLTAGLVTNGVYTTGSYADPGWITSLAGSKISGAVATATALAANGANCAAGQYPLGVDASGAVESCTAALTGSGTATQLAYWSSGSALTGSANLYWNNAAGHLGINTNAPNQELQVVGNANISGTLYASTISSNSPLTLQTAGTTRVFVNDTTGYVGIGTNAPASTLTINGSTTILPMNYSVPSSSLAVSSFNTTVASYNYGRVRVAMNNVFGYLSDGYYLTQANLTNLSNQTTLSLTFISNALAADSDRVYVGGYGPSGSEYYNMYMEARNASNRAFLWNLSVTSENGTSFEYFIDATTYGGIVYGLAYSMDSTLTYSESYIVAANTSTGTIIWQRLVSNASNSLSRSPAAITANSYGVFALYSSAVAVEAYNLTTGAKLWYQNYTSPAFSFSQIESNNQFLAAVASSYVASINMTTGALLWNRTIGTTGYDVAVIGNEMYVLNISGSSPAVAMLNASSGVQTYQRAFSAFGATTPRITQNGSKLFTGTLYGSYTRDIGVIDISNASTSTAVSLAVGHVGSYPLDIYSSSGNAYVASFDNDGDLASLGGIRIQAGADGGSGTTYYLTAADGDGDITGYIQSSSGTFQLVDVSDRKTKVNIKPREFDGLDKIRNVSVVEYNRKQNPNGPKITGFVAQDLQKVYPEAVAVGPDGNLGVAKAELVPLLFKGMQEQQAQIDLQQQQIDALAQGKQLPKGQQQLATQQTPPNNGGGTPTGNDVIVQLGQPQDVVVTLG